MDVRALFRKIYRDELLIKAEEDQGPLQDCTRSESIGILIGNNKRTLTGRGTGKMWIRDYAEGLVGYGMRACLVLSGRTNQSRIKSLAASIRSCGAGHTISPDSSRNDGVR